MADPAGFPQLAAGSVATVGTFDGVHLGHRDILRRLQARAAATRLPALLVTFRPHPLDVVNPSAAPMLLGPGEEQREALVESGPLLVAVLPFTLALARLSAEAFVVDVLRERYHIQELVVGYDHGLGRGRQGDADLLARLGIAHGFRVERVPALLDSSGVPVSSSAIRNSIAHGDLERAHRALGRAYSLHGTVVPGSQRGRDLGYPTLNVQLGSPRKLLPPDGVYAVRVRGAPGSFGGMMNLGGRPTFGEGDRTVEAHLFDAAGDWYGRVVSIEIIRRLRDTVRFANVDALVAQLGHDAVQARIALTQA